MLDDDRSETRKRRANGQRLAIDDRFDPHQPRAGCPGRHEDRCGAFEPFTRQIEHTPRPGERRPVRAVKRDAGSTGLFGEQHRRHPIEECAGDAGIARRGTQVVRRYCNPRRECAETVRTYSSAFSIVGKVVLTPT